MHAQVRHCFRALLNAVLQACGIPGPLCNVLLRALDPLPSNRFSSASAMWTALEACGASRTLCFFSMG